MRIDAHQHFWNYDEREYVWMGPEHNAIRRDFLPDDLAPLLDSIDFDGSIAVQARQSIVETEWLLALASRYSRILGVVGWIDLRSNRVGEQVQQYASDPRLVGVRHVVHDEADDDFVLRSDFQHGVSLLEPAGLTYDLLLFPRHIAPATRLVDAFPNQPFVVDHIAKPLIAAGTLEPWLSDIRNIASRENVWCKLSGLVTEADRHSWTHSDFVPYLDSVLEAFGPDRLMIGSDWPVCTLGGDYRSVMNIVIEYAQKLSSTEQDAILGRVAASFYGTDIS